MRCTKLHLLSQNETVSTRFHECTGTNSSTLEHRFDVFLYFSRLDTYQDSIRVTFGTIFYYYQSGEICTIAMCHDLFL
jgi:hypothetical protein